MKLSHVGSRPTPRASFSLLWLWASLSSACSMIVGSGQEAPLCKLEAGKADPCGQGLECRSGHCLPLRECEQDGEGSCPASQECRGGRCVGDPACVPTKEICGDKRDNDCDGKTDEEPDPTRDDTCGDRIDNDCNGEIDEGHDADGDGNEWCGDTTQPSGAEMADCNDRDPDVYFGAPEQCDGVDNDCNGEIDEAAAGQSLCPEGQQCLGRCVEPSCAFGGTVLCKADEMCNAATGKCIPKGACQESGCLNEGEICDSLTGDCIQPKANGQACGAHLECRSGSCMESHALLLAGKVNFVCGQACCSDDDCGTDEVCFDPGTGGRSCLPKSLVQRDGSTAPPCSIDRDCRGGEACGLVPGGEIDDSTFESRTDVVTAACRTPAASQRRPGKNANFNALTCTSQAAIPISVLGFFGATYLCTSMCGTTADCDVIGSASGEPNKTYCSFEQGGPGGKSTFAMCVVARSSLEIGSGGLGSPCSSGADCRDGACVSAGEITGVCATACCNDAQCGKIGDVQTHCRPVPFGDHYETRCVP